MAHGAALWSSRISHFFGGLTAITFLQFVKLFLEVEQSSRIRPIHYVFATGTAISCLTPWLVADVPPKLLFPYYPEPGILYLFLLASYFYTYVAAFRLLLLTYRNRELPYAKRMQAVVILCGVFLAWINVATLFLPIYNIPVVPQLSLLPLIGVFTVYAIIRYRFLDIRIVLRRSLVYSLLIACITATYLVMVLITERWFQGFFGYHSVFATVVVAFLIAIFFNPLRDRIQTFVDRALFKATPAELAAQREQLLAEVRKGDQQKAVATLAAGLAHEIKNPLASIKTFTEYLDAHYQDPEFRAKFQKIVGGEVERINLIVQQLLEFAKPVPPKLMPVAVPKLLDETLEFLTNELVTHHIGVTKRYTASQPVLADPQQLKQVFLNLFLNSLQAMNGSGQLTIQTALHGAELTVTIQDNGTGIDPKDLPHIFEPFYTTKPTGTGLGLAVVQGIIKEHGGRIAVQSEPGRGTTVGLHLPTGEATGNC